MSAASVETRRMPIGQQIANFGAQLGRRLSRSSSTEASEVVQYSASSSQVLLPDSAETATVDSTTPSTTTRSNSRSTSRGRDAFMSSGRGGLGNIRKTTQDQPEQGRARDPNDCDYISPVRGREAVKRVGQSDNLMSVGRGGLGNIRSPSNDVNSPTEQNVAQYEKTVIQASTEAARTGVYSYGRGGLGNLRSPSVQRTPSTTTVTEEKTLTLLERARALSRSRSRPPKRS